MAWNDIFNFGYNRGFKAGYNAGYGHIPSSTWNNIWEAGYQRGYKIGFNAAWSHNPGGQPFEMFDTVDVATMPDNPVATAGYVDGHWPTSQQLIQRFPHAKHLSIAVFPSDNAECLDVESGDATPSEAVGWVRRQHARGIARPVVYCSLSVVPNVAQELQAAGIPRSQVRIWSAHYTYQPHICRGIPTAWGTIDADATQWTDTALGRNLDESLCAANFL
jgi:hypothetical protein